MIKNSCFNELLKYNDLSELYDNFKNNFDGVKNEYEFNLLLNNGLIDPSLILSMKFSFHKLKILFEKLTYRIFIVGNSSANGSEVGNCLIGRDILIETQNICIIVKFNLANKSEAKESNNNSSNTKLFNCNIVETFTGIEFIEKEILCTGEESIKETLSVLDNEKDINNLMNLNSLSEYVFIIHTDQNSNINNISQYDQTQNFLRTDILLMPALSLKNCNVLPEIFQNLMEQDNHIKLANEEKMKNLITEELKIQSRFEEEFTEDFYFKNYIYNRPLKKNIIFNVITPENILSNSYIDFIEGKKASDINSTNSQNYVQQYLIVNNSDKITCDFVLNLIENYNINNLENFSFNQNQNENEDLTSYLDLLKDNKLSNQVKDELCKKIVSKFIYKSFNTQLLKSISCKMNIVFISSFYSLLGKIQHLDNESKHNFNNRLFKKIENNIYKTIEDFEESKLKFLVKKSSKYQEDFTIFETFFWEQLYNFNAMEINYYYSSSLRYSIIINDMLNIPIETSTSLEIRDTIDLEATLIVYKKLIEDEYEAYNDIMVKFYADFSREIEELYEKGISKIKKWTKSNFLYTSSKFRSLTKKFRSLIMELNIKLENFINEIIEKDIQLVISIKEKLKNIGYLNEYISKYLSNIQHSIFYEINKDGEIEDQKINNIFISLGITGGIGLASGLITFGISRAVTMIAADAISGTVVGPIGTIAGATVGAISIIGTSVYNIIKNKKLLTQRYEELQITAENYRNYVYDKMVEFRVFNKEEIERRIQKLLSYVELSVRKSVKF